MGVVFANCNLSVQCLRIMEISEDYNGEGPICIKYMPKKNDIKKIGHKVRVENSFTTIGVDLDDIPSLSIVDSYLDKDIQWIGNHKPPKFIWQSGVFTSYTGYYGNEASSTDFYTYAAIVATIAPYDERCDDFKPTTLSVEQLGISTESTPKSTPKLTGRKRKEPDTPRTDTRPTKVSKTSEPEPGSAPSAVPVFYAPVEEDRENGIRQITVIGGQGGLASRCNGRAVITLQPGQGLRELKQLLRRHFGKVPSMRMSSLVLVNEDGTRGGAVATKDLVDGMTLACTYTIAPGNPEALRPYGGRRGTDDCIIS